MSSYQLRPADDRDSDELLRIHLAAMSAHLETALGAWSEARAREHHDAWLRSGRAQVIVINGVIAGLLDVVWKQDVLHVVRIEIDPAFQGRGVGAAIMADLLAEARRRGIPARLDVFVSNPARGLYERLGFREIGREGPAVTMEWPPTDRRP